MAFHTPSVSYCLLSDCTTIQHYSTIVIFILCSIFFVIRSMLLFSVISSVSLIIFVPPSMRRQQRTRTQQLRPACCAQALCTLPSNQRRRCQIPTIRPRILLTDTFNHDSRRRSGLITTIISVPGYFKPPAFTLFTIAIPSRARCRSAQWVMNTESYPQVKLQCSILRSY